MPTPAITTNSGVVPGGSFMCPSSFNTPRSGSYHEAPPPAAVPPYTTMTQFVAQPLAQPHPAPGYGGLGTGYDDTDPHFRPGQQTGPGWTNTSLRETSDFKQSRKRRREGAKPFAQQTARSGRKARQTLADNNDKTPANDRGHEDIAGLFTERCLPVLPQGPDAPPPTTGARGSKKTGRTKKGKKTQASLESPQQQQQMPPAVYLGNRKWGCPHEDCMTTCSRPYDVKRHWDVIHADDRSIFYCVQCCSTFNRLDNAQKHIILMHGRKVHEEDIIEFRIDETQIALKSLTFLRARSSYLYDSPSPASRNPGLETDSRSRVTVLISHLRRARNPIVIKSGAAAVTVPVRAAGLDLEIAGPCCSRAHNVYGTSVHCTLSSTWTLPIADCLCDGGIPSARPISHSMFNAQDVRYRYLSSVYKKFLYVGTRIRMVQMDLWTHDSWTFRKCEDLHEGWELRRMIVSELFLIAFWARSNVHADALRRSWSNSDLERRTPAQGNPQRSASPGERLMGRPGLNGELPSAVSGPDSPDPSFKSTSGPWPSNLAAPVTFRGSR
ncbi:hypothetical protein EVG20_g9904 [Dentipellis fragilis]|uniref:C2H2-type domain-containing protein n=1 Tax=Dentipellis fragilis TaxID=205917 RepID=A0A4Y9XVZ0_9AGAM|nr:hypothetical protein EVG20_g9904 [Dentipellis fragilis]